MPANTKNLKLMSAINKLNTQQEIVVKHVKGPLIVGAGPGTGKSTTLVGRVAYLIEKYPNDTDHMYVLTFTNTAVDSFRKKSSKLVNIKHYPQNDHKSIHISTIDGLGNRLIKDLAKRAKKLTEQGKQVFFPYNINESIKGLYIMDEDTRFFMIKLAYQMVTNSSVNNSIGQKIANKASDVIGRWKHNFLTPTDIRIAAKYSKQKNAKLFSKIYTVYEQEKERESVIDFDDTCYLPTYIMQKDAGAKLYLQQFFDYLNVDECQDTNKVQLIMMEQLIDKTKNICIVGDTDQILYDWRGANTNITKDFKNKYGKYKNYKYVNLKVNYRSERKSYVYASQRLINYNSDHDSNKKQLIPCDNTTRGPKILTYSARTGADEARFVANKILEYLRQYNYKPGDFSILYRRKIYPYMVNGLIAQLEKRHIKYRISENDTFYNHKCVKYYIKYLQAILHPTKSVYLAHFLYISVRGIGIKTVAKLVKIAHMNKINLLNLLLHIYDYKNIKLNTNKYNSLFHLGKTIIKNRKYLHDNKLRNGISYIIRNSKLRSKLIWIANNNKPAKAKKASKDLNIINYIPQKLYKELYLKYHPTLRNRSSIIQLSTVLMKINNSITDGTKNKRNPNRVNLGTIHSAKGTQNKVIFVVGMQNGIFPKRSDMKSKTKMMSERRIAYVAMTRAQDFLFMTHAAEGCLYSRNPYKPDWWGFNSTFIDEITPEYTDAQRYSNSNPSPTPSPIISKSAFVPWASKYQSPIRRGVNKVNKFKKSIQKRHQIKREQKKSNQEHDKRVREYFKHNGDIF